MCDYCRTISFAVCFNSILCKLPEDGDYVKTCRRKLILKYTIYVIVYLLVLMEFLIQKPNMPILF